MRAKAVIGLGFGDEGKGVTVDWLCSLATSPTTVVRYSGGHQAGHHVVHPDKQHIFSNLGSGTLRGAATAWEECCTVEPVGLSREWKILSDLGHEPLLYLNPKCPITTPFEIEQNGRCITTKKHGSCGVGFYATLKREHEGKHILVEDLYHQDIFEMKVRMLDKDSYYLNRYSVESFFAACDWIRNNPRIKMVQDIEAQEYIFEGSQGLLLDKDIGFMPHCTPSNVGMNQLAKLYPNDTFTPYYVTRCYQTRHGNGPMTDHRPGFVINNEGETNVSTGTQGVFRKSILDVPLLRYALAKDGGPRGALVVTCLEHLPTYAFYDNGYKEFIKPEHFCEELSRRLGILHVFMCMNYNFTPVC